MKTESIDQLSDWDVKHVWHPYCQMKIYAGTPPIILESAHGHMIRDMEGNEYIDTVGGLWNVNLGYGNSELVEAALHQMSKLAYVNLCNFTHAPAVNLAKKLVDFLPDGLTRIFYCNGGGEGNDTAIKMARQFHRQTGNPLKTKVFSLNTGYHGTTYGALSATGSRRDQYKFEPLVPGFVHVPAPQIPESPADQYESHCRLCLEQLERTLEYERPETVAAILIEPILGCGGIQTLTESYIKGLRRVCDHNRVVLIFDEVVTAFGRTGHMFAAEHHGVAPDILVMSKGITSGYLPLGAVAAREDIFQAFWSDDRDAAFLHGFTSSGNPVCCAVALRNIELIERDHLCERARETGNYLLASLRDALAGHRSVRDVRGIGLMIGIEFCDPARVNEPPPVGFVSQIVKHLMKNGVIMRTLGSRNNIIVLMPPLIIPKEAVDEVVSKLKLAVRDTEAAAGTEPIQRVSSVREFVPPAVTCRS